MLDIPAALGGTLELGWLLGLGTAVVLVVAATSSLRRLGPDERGVVRAASGSRRVIGPGPVLLVPGYHRLRRVDVSPRPVDPLVAVGTSRDGARVRLIGAATLQVVDPRGAVEHADPVRRVAAALELALARQLARRTVDEVGPHLAEIAGRARREIADSAARHGVAVRSLAVHEVEVVLSTPHPPAS